MKKLKPHHVHALISCPHNTGCFKMLILFIEKEGTKAPQMLLWEFFLPSHSDHNDVKQFYLLSHSA